MPQLLAWPVAAASAPSTDRAVPAITQPACLSIMEAQRTESPQGRLSTMVPSVRLHSCTSPSCTTQHPLVQSVPWS